MRSCMDGIANIQHSPAKIPSVRKKWTKKGPDYLAVTIR